MAWDEPHPTKLFGCKTSPDRERVVPTPESTCFHDAPLRRGKSTDLSDLLPTSTAFVGLNRTIEGVSPLRCEAGHLPAWASSPVLGKIGRSDGSDVRPSLSWSSVDEELWPGGRTHLEGFRTRFLEMTRALHQSNNSVARLQGFLEKSLERCASLERTGVEARRSRDHHHHQWCVLEQERESFQRMAQQAQAAGRAAQESQRTVFNEATQWRELLASLLKILFRGHPGTQSPRHENDDNARFTQETLPNCLPVHDFLKNFANSNSLEPDSFSSVQEFFQHLSELSGSGELTVQWGSSTAEIWRKKASEAETACRRLTNEVEAALKKAENSERALAERDAFVLALESEKLSLRSEVRTLQDLVQELRGSIRVFCRVRPPRRPVETQTVGARVDGPQRVTLKKPPGERRHDFSFDRAFPPEASQRDLFDEIEPVLPGVLAGTHLCILAYGQTGAGKTYTLAGNELNGEPGIQDLAISKLLGLAAASEVDVNPSESESLSGTDNVRRYDIHLSALEIYNESVQDLLVDVPSTVFSNNSGHGTAWDVGLEGSRLEVRQTSKDDDLSLLADSSDGLPPASPFGSMRVPGLRSWKVECRRDIDEALRKMQTNRRVAATAVNERSSRSHCLLSLSFAPRGRVSGEPNGVGVLHIVDLAGSERTKVSQAEGQQLKEANCINRSLSSLADVLYALGDSDGPSSHIPYRNSKLTFLLQDALGGLGCKTFLFAQISPDPADAHESYSTLTFASRVATSVQKGKLKPVGDGVHSGSHLRTGGASRSSSLQRTPPKRSARLSLRGASVPPLPLHVAPVPEASPVPIASPRSSLSDFIPTLSSSAQANQSRTLTTPSPAGLTAPSPPSKLPLPSQIYSRVRRSASSGAAIGGGAGSLNLSNFATPERNGVATTGKF